MAALFGPADLRERALEERAEIAGIELRGRIVGHETADIERHFLRGDEVAAPDIRRIDPEIGSRDIDQPLAEEVRLDAPWPAVGPGWCLVARHGR